MEKSTKTALLIAATGYIVNKYEGSKISTEKPALTTEESNIKITAGLVTALGVTSAVILELTKNSPRGRKIAFVGMGGLTIAWFLTIIYAMKKMT
jgi:hypothetical protein